MQILEFTQLPSQEPFSLTCVKLAVCYNKHKPSLHPPAPTATRSIFTLAVTMNTFSQAANTFNWKEAESLFAIGIQVDVLHNGHCRYLSVMGGLK